MIVNDIYVDRLRNRRIEKGITQKEMAKKLGYKSTTSYMYIEQGKYQTDIQRMNLISEILDKPINYFFNLKVQ